MSLLIGLPPALPNVGTTCPPYCSGKAPSGPLLSEPGTGADGSLPPFLPQGPQVVAPMPLPNLTDAQIHNASGSVDCSVGGWEQQLSCSAGQLAQKVIANLGLLALAGAGIYLVFRPQIDNAVKTGVKAAALA